ncbi:ATP-binding protein [Saccharopolyspora sp. NPDC049426]|uniref:ATP-binding protein n=1 Tax=Saccharopolyspora sp. NPDC049426 TaxID=3155652 RepID=UPI00343FF7FD
MARAQPGEPESASPGVEVLRRHGVRATAGTLPVLRDEVGEWARAADLRDTIVESLALATDEAMANAVEHAYADAPGVLDLDAVRSESGVEVAVTDHGTWPAPDEGDGQRNRGLPLVERLADESVVASGARGTRVQMRWNTSVRPGDDMAAADT